MANNNRRRGKGRGSQQKKNESKPKTPEIKKNENGIFDFSDEELANDNSLKLIRRDNGDTKYASFDDYLKDH